jgi:RNA polymerase sigma-70 factor (ECF subfamily)
MDGLASSFHGTTRGSNPDTDEALEAALQAFCAEGRAAWPGLSLDDGALAAYLGERAPADAAPVTWLAGLRAGDLFLACACAAGVPQALRAFEATFLVRMDVHLRAIRPTPELVAETRQELLEKLFVGAPGRPPKIRQYAGHGALGGWVRVAAVRTALNLLEAQKADRPRADEAEELARAIVPDSDPEIELMRATYKDGFLASFREAMLALPRRERSLLRFTFVERLTPARIGAMQGVHRTTVLRWIEAAQEELLAGTRARLMERLHISASECDGVFALVKSRIDLRLASLLRSAS